MKLMTKKIAKSLPPLYALDGKPASELIVRVKYFSPYTNWTWAAWEFDGEDIMFGLVCGFENEIGYFSLKEMEEVTIGPGVPAIERDMYFEPCPVSEVPGCPQWLKNYKGG